MLSFINWFKTLIVTHQSIKMFLSRKTDFIFGILKYML